MSRDLSPFHSGEKAIQHRLGIADVVEEQTRGFIRPAMPDQHRDFFQQLPFIMLGAVDASGQPWITPVFGKPGFIESPDAYNLAINQRPAIAQILDLQLSVGNKLGLLGIELPTRRRNRMNGKVAALGEHRLEIQVDQSFGNCPKYIQQRSIHLTPAANPLASDSIQRSHTIDAQAKAILETTDTFFISSRTKVFDDDPRHGIDASHRGGKPGFIKVEDNHITFPDFSGNRFFNTLGNIIDDGRVGLFVPDFHNGDALFISGTATVVWDEEAIARFAGAERLIDIAATQIINVKNFLATDSELIEPSPFLIGTGTWDKEQSEKKSNSHYRKLIIDKKVVESGSITSFYLKPSDGQALDEYLPGQHLPITLDIKNNQSKRSYSLSQAPNTNRQHYRLSIKREDQGRVSRALHDHYDIGSYLFAQAPAGHFTLKETGHSVVLLSSGVGITPMIAMLEALIERNTFTPRPRPVYFIHSTQNSISHGFKQQLEDWSRDYSWLHYLLAYSQPTPKDQVEKTHHLSGRLTIDSIRSLLDKEETYDIYLCGSEGFMRTQFHGLKQANITGVSSDRIYYEFFGAGSIEEKTEQPEKAMVKKAKVKFSRSQKTVEWRPEEGSLLELAENNGLSPPFSCRSGNCGACATKLEGDITYQPAPDGRTLDSLADGKVLLCCAHPSDDTNKDPEIIIDL